MKDVVMVGPPKKDGPLPAFFYFTLSGKDSLHTDPFNQPVQRLKNQPIRCFSWDVPFHHEGSDPHKALEKWHHSLEEGTDFLTPFIEKSVQIVHDLIDEGLVDPKKMCVGGLSRGGLIATHLAAKTKISHLLGFAPLTKYYSLDVLPLAPLLLHKTIRFYIGNHDERVKTDLCYTFIRTLAEMAYAKRTRHHAFELFIRPSIGYQGHGTSKDSFFEGADWLVEEFGL